MSDSWETSVWPAADHEDEIRRREIEEMMRGERERYFRDEAVQQEYRDIIGRQIARAESEANQNSTRPGPFDEALARFQANRALAPGGQEGRADLESPAPAERPVQVASNNPAFVPESPPRKADDRSLSPRGGLDAGEALFGQDSADQPADTKPKRVRVAPSDAPAGSGPSSQDASRRSSMTALRGDPEQLFDKKFKGTPLEGHWKTMRAAAEKNGIPPTLAAAIMAQETGNGANVSKNNPGGYMDPKTKWMTKKQFPTLEAGINVTVANIARRYREAGADLTRLRDIYAPLRAANDRKNLNQHWLRGVQDQLKEYGDFTSFY